MRDNLRVKLHKKSVKLNNNGFTLVEVLVSVVILGIIVGLAYPAVSNMQARNNNKKYDYYADSLKEAAKVYVTTNEKDFAITDNTEKNNYCFNVDYNQLLAKGLIKPYTDKGIDCSQGTYVQIVKKNGQDYDYEANLVCKSNGVETYKDEIANTCNASDFYPPTVDIKLDLASDKKSLIATVKITDPSKINLKENHNTITYAWSDYENEYVDGLVFESYTVTDADLDASGNVTFTKNLEIPPSENTKYFIMNATGIEDGAGNVVKSGNSISKISKVYDTLPPSIVTINAATKNANYNTREVDLSLTLAKSESSIKYRTSMSSTFSGDWKTALGSGTNWNVGSIDVGDDYTGANKTIYVQVQDVNSNVSATGTKAYTTYKYCTKTGTWTDPSFSICTKKCDTGRQGRTRKLYDLYFTSYECGSSYEEKDCNPTACCSSYSLNNNCTGWSTCPCGGGTQSRTCGSYSKLDSSVSCGNKGQSQGCSRQCCTVEYYNGNYCWDWVYWKTGTHTVSRIQVCKSGGTSCQWGSEYYCGILGGSAGYNTFKYCPGW